ncbi:hypothetical protein FH609_016245 [Streptomyces sp. 3MP-14]|uniref:Exo-alpha-sialidase n=1 Tax=Streptomyces mimosae TaxID=2586635 RepID=A0A5N6A8K7_9ACTN|nr:MULTISPECIES: hypothetical protein [Streptomyces]KAB8165144.1 hypothetical protein FH607_013570 [Streptomyces mimosae]KAB8175776.1 hypothetical protein FH609_016245 [Streptomyces sp. 3MP-14]
MPRRSLLPQVLLLTALTLLSCTATDQAADDPAASPPPSATPAPAPSADPPPIPSEPQLSGQVVQLSFAGPEHAAALLVECRHGATRQQGNCAYRVAVLDGDRWQTRDTPLPTTTAANSLFTVEAVGERGVRVSTGEEDWVSTDGGLRWTDSAESAGPEGEAAEVIPEGAVPRPAGQDADERGLEVVSPQDAGPRRLAAQPELTELGRPGRLPEGGWWVAGLDPETGRPDVAVTLDAGREWRRLRLLDQAAPADRDAVNSLVLAAGPADWYVLASGNAALEPGSSALATTLLAVYRSADEGARWERVWSPSSGPGPHSLVGTPIAAADGSLTVYSFDAIYTSADRGETFEVTRPGAPPELPELTPAGYLLTDLSQPGHYRISADGFTWRTIVLGRPYETDPT